MISPRWLIGITMFLVISYAICNFVDGEQVITQGQSNTVTNMTSVDFISVTDSTGGETNYVNMALSTLRTIMKALSWDYTFFHDIDPLTGADRNSEMQLVLTFFRMLFFSLTVGILFSLAYALRRLVTG